MGRYIINTVLALILLIMLFSLYRVLSGRAQEQTNVAKLKNVYDSELSLSKNLNTAYEYYSSTEYVEKVSRDNLNLAKPGEYILVLPSITQIPATKNDAGQKVNRQSPAQEWLDLLIH